MSVAPPTTMTELPPTSTQVPRRLGSPIGHEHAMNFWNPATIATTLGGRWLVSPTSADGSSASTAVTGEIENPGVGIDSRTIEPGQIFVAIRGDRHDGHDFLASAASRGASMLIIDRVEAFERFEREFAVIGGTARGEGTPPAALLVADTSLALLGLAAAWRRELSATRVVAITGSNGKTTTTRLIEGVLSASMQGVASIKSFNNRIGVPLTILRARPTDRFLACEVGTNAIGEIAEIAPVVAPDITVITSIGREHLEGLGGLEGSSREAVELVRSLRPGGVAIIPFGVRELEIALAGAIASRGEGPIRIERFGESPDADWHVSGIVSDLSGVRFTLTHPGATFGSKTLEAPVLGRHNGLNAAVAAAVAAHVGVDSEGIRLGLSSARGADMRLQHTRRVIRAGEPAIDILNDAYNANPESMLAAIDAFRQIFGRQDPGTGGRRRVAVLGDMRELGEQGPECHREIGEAAARSGAFDLLVFIGPLMMFAADRARKALPADRVIPIGAFDDAATAEAAACLKPGDAVLIKASRGIGLERVLSHLGPSA